MVSGSQTDYTDATPAAPFSYDHVMISDKPLTNTLRNFLLFASPLLSVVTLSQAQIGACPNSVLAGHWQGTMSRQGADVSVAFDFVCANRELRASFTSLQQRAMEYPFDSAKQTGNQVDLVLGGDTYLSAALKNSELAGTFKDEDGSGTFQLSHVADVQPPYSVKDVVFKNGDVTLAGSLYVPHGRGLHPGIVMLQGSGPETRWGANRFWADYFGRRGIATLIYDKRGSGKSGGDWQTADFNALAGDALAGVSFLQRQATIDPKKIGIHGHSQGASIAPLIASKSKSVAFVLADAANGIPMWQTEVYSQQSFIRHAGLTENDLAKADKFIEHLVQVARTGNGYDALVQEHEAAKQRGEVWTNEVGPPATSNYWLKFFQMIANYNPADYWKQVEVPVLIVEAGADERIPVDSSVAAIQMALNEGHNPDYTIVVFPNAPHPLVERSKAGEIYHWPHITPGYADLLASWVLYRESRNQ